jgi:hypothetical protein
MPLGSQKGSYSVPGGSKSGRRKGFRRAEEGAMSVFLEKISKKEEKIKE